MRSRFPPLLILALVAYLGLAATTVREVGVVGEVALGWRWGPPVEVRVVLDQPPIESTSGPFRARATRPIERLVVGPIELPVAINTYTGGLPDWPARLIHAVTRSTHAVWALHISYGMVLIGALFAFLRRHIGIAPAGAAALVLATRWDFLFYRSVLGGTEAVLVGSTLAMIWALWSRRWRGHPWGLTAIALAFALGLHAKVTFAVVAGAIAAAALLLKNDRPAMGPPAASRTRWTALALLLPTVPLVGANLHQRWLPGPAIRSHDHIQLQLERVVGALTGSAAPTRESLGNIWPWLADPLGFLAHAYGVVERPDPPVALAVLGWVVLVAGTARVWHRRHPTPRDALLRFSSIVLVLGVGGALVVARDLHHLATFSVVVALVAGLAADQLAGTWFPPRSRRRVWAAALFVSPWVVSGGMHLAQTDAVVRRVKVPTFRASGQAALAELVATHSVETLWVCDYEAMGALELSLPQNSPVHIIHAWGAASRRATDRDLARRFPDALLRAATGGHLLLVDASAPMIYNLRTRGRFLDEAATRAGVRLEEIGRLPETSAGEAILIAVHPIGDQRAARP